MECKGCNRTFSTKYTLATHQRNSKTCGNGDGFKCELCDKIFTSKLRLTTHTTICKATPNREEVINTKLAEYKAKIESLERALQDKTEELDVFLKKQKDRKPLNLDSDIIREKITSRIDIKDIKKGQRGIAEFIVKNILKDESGTLLYRCVDISRNKFIYYDVDGNRCVDYRAQVLVNCLVLSEIFNDIREISKNFYNFNDTDEFIEWYNIIDSISNIRNFEKNKKFRRYICMLTV